MSNKTPVIGMVGDTPIEATNALTFLSDGRDFLKTYELLNDNTKRIELFKVKYFLLSRSMELFLKSLIKFSTGDTVNNNKTHNLIKLYDKVNSVLTLKTEEVELLKNLNNYYPEGKKLLEYSQVRNESMELPTLENTYALAKKMLLEVIKFKDNEATNL